MGLGVQGCPVISPWGVQVCAPGPGGSHAPWSLYRGHFIIFSGGMPRASYGDRHCVSVLRAETLVTLDFTSRIIDFFTVHSTKEVPPGKTCVSLERLLVIIGFPATCLKPRLCHSRDSSFPTNHMGPTPHQPTRQGDRVPFPQWAY